MENVPDTVVPLHQRGCELAVRTQLTEQELATLIKANPTGNGREYAVVDVRDSDFAVSRLDPSSASTFLYNPTVSAPELPDRKHKDPATLAVLQRSGKGEGRKLTEGKRS